MNSKITFLILFVNSLLIFLPINAQEPIFEWAKNVGGVNWDIGNQITCDSNGNIYITGVFAETADFDPNAGTANLTSLGGYDIFVQKLNNNGNLVWAKRMGGTLNDHGLSIATDSAGNVYTIGVFSGTVDFDPNAGIVNLTSIDGSYDTFIQKLDTNGNLVWIKQIGGTTTDNANSITIDGNGNILVSGFFDGVTDFDPGAGTTNLTAVGGTDIFLLKLDTNGDFIWVKQMGGTDSEYGTFIDSDSDRNVYMTGNFAGTVDFDPGAGTMNLTAVAGSDIFVVKLDEDGTLLWAKQMGSNDNDAGLSLTIDNNNNVYTTGYFYQTVDFDPGAGTYNLTAYNNSDIFVQKLDTNGNFVWAKYMGGLNSDYGTSIVNDVDGNIYVMGMFAGEADFDSGIGTITLTGNGGEDIFIEKYDSSGNEIWVAQMGAGSHDYGYSLATDTFGNLYSTGTFRNTVDFDPGSGTTNLTSLGEWDIFIQKLSVATMGLMERSFSDNLIVFPNPTKGQFTLAFKDLQSSFTVKLLTISGQLIMDKKYKNIKNIQLELNQPKGIYLLEVFDDEYNKTVYKIIRQ